MEPAPVSPPPQPQPQLPQQSQPVSKEKDVEDNKDLAAFSYVWIFSVLVYISQRKSPFVRFHAKQGMILFLMSIAFWFIPYIGKFLELLVLFGAAWGFLHAAQGKKDEVPFVGPLSRGKLSLRPSMKKTVEGVAHGVDEAKKIWKHKQEVEEKKTPSPPTPSQPPSPPEVPQPTPLSETSVAEQPPKEEPKEERGFPQGPTL